MQVMTFQRTELSPTRVGIVGTYVPRRCGIATFTSDLLHALSDKSPEQEFWAVAVSDANNYAYPPEVQYEINQKIATTYRTAVDFLDINGVEAISLQHEFGIFGGTEGSYILKLLQNLRIPVVTTLHTILEEPEPEKVEIIRALNGLSDRFVVMSERGRRILNSVYGISDKRIAVIPHGVPDMPFLDTSYHKDRFGLVGKKVILTYGLLSPDKGIEYVVEALPGIVEAHPDTVFVVAGQTHPGVVRTKGESYRTSLQERARELGVADHVVFLDRFIDPKTLSELVSIADICITPYLKREQIVSGVLSYALGAGKAIVSTPYRYAEEILDDGRGRLVPFRDSGAIAREVIHLLSNDIERQAMRKRAYEFARKMVWKIVSAKYLKLFDEVRRERALRPRFHRTKALQNAQQDLPSPRLDHLSVLTDDTGILQHSNFGVPDRNHGYCTDDNARALIVALLGQRVVRDSRTLTPFAYRYLSFLHHAFNTETGRFRNFMGFDRQWQETVGSEDSHGRALWALGLTVADPPAESMVGAAATLFERALPGVLELSALRAWSYALVGLDGYLRRFAGGSDARRARTILAERLFEAAKERSSPDWPWPEDKLTYANGAIPHALILSGHALLRDEMVEFGLKSLRWLTDIQTDPRGYFTPIGNRGWFERGGTPSRFDQQPIEAQHMVDALLQAHQVTGDARWLADARRCFEWFLGRNDLQQPIADLETGGCRDGLNPDRVNPNQGAESTLAWLHSLLKLHVTIRAEVATTPASVSAIRRPTAAAAVAERAASMQN